MKLLLLSILLTFSAAISGFAQQLQPLGPALESLKPVNIFPANADTSFEFSDRGNGVKPALFEVDKSNNAFPVFSTEVFFTTKSHFDVSVRWKSTVDVKKGDVLLARLAMRSIYAKQESGEAVVTFFVQTPAPSYAKSIMIALGSGPEWKTYDIPFVAAQDMPVGDAQICISFGSLAQKVNISGIQVLNFENKLKLEALPVTKFTYAGREAGAAWREEALARIEKIRKAPLVVQVTNKNGKPVKGAVVKAKLVDPEFIFGTAVTAKFLGNDLPDSEIYKKILLEQFNAGTIDNGLKWPLWINEKSRVTTKIAVDWMTNNHLKLRGHNLVWPGKTFTPAVYTKQPGFGPGFSDSITKHIEEIATYTKGRVYAWDVINEMLHEKDYFNVMPRTQAAEWFKQARRIDPNAALYINEYAMLNTVESPRNIKSYLELIAELESYGAPIDAIGVQGHVGRQPRNPAQVISDLDMFIEKGLPVQITEFDVNTTDEELQADYTRDFLIACYSHPIVTGFTMWGFWEGAHWKPNAAMYRKDWSPKPNAAVWNEWVTQKWRTNIIEATNADGKITSSGHLGRYEITVTTNKTTKTVIYQLTKNASPAVIQL